MSEIASPLLHKPCKSGPNKCCQNHRQHKTQPRFWSERRTTPHFKHKHCLLWLTLTFGVLAAGVEAILPRRPLPSAITSSSTSSSTLSAAASKRHLLSGTPPNTEYFYANDKLADEQVASFVNSLQNGSSSPSAMLPLHQRPSVPLTSGGQLSAIRTSQLAASSVFPASLVTRASVLSAHSSSSSSSSSFSSSSPELSSSKPSSTSRNEGANYSSLLTTRQSAKEHPTNINTFQPNQQNQKQNESRRWQPSLPPEYDLSWVQPVYVPAKKDNTSSSAFEPKLQLNAFKSDPIDLFPVPNTNLTFNRTMLNSPSDRSDDVETLDSSNHSSTIEDRLEAFSAALANMTFSLREEQWVAPIIALSMLNIMVILGFECFVIYRACR